MTANVPALPEPYSKFALSLVAVGALITDPDGRVLMVRPHHNPHWTFVGGMVDIGEAPHEGCAREIREEIGLDLAVGASLVTDWAPPTTRRPLPITYLVFDCGTVESSVDLVIQAEEIAEWAFLSPEEAANRLAPNVSARLPAALAARADGRSIYLPGSGR